MVSDNPRTLSNNFLGIFRVVKGARKEIGFYVTDDKVTFSGPSSFKLFLYSN